MVVKDKRLGVCFMYVGNGERKKRSVEDVSKLLKNNWKLADKS